MTAWGADSGSDSSDNSFITILSTGAYRIKGQVNEQNRNTVVPGSAVIVRSRVDENQILAWNYGGCGRAEFYEQQ